MSFRDGHVLMRTTKGFERVDVDSTRISAADVDFPLLDVAIYLAGECRILQHRYEKNDLLELSTWWEAV